MSNPANSLYGAISEPKITAITHSVEISSEDRLIVKRLSEGYTAPQISEKEGINKRTLEGKILALRKAFSCSTKAQLVALFIFKGIIKYKP